MSIQALDINDGDIINATSTEQVGPDAFQYKYTLPSGAALESTAFNSDNRRSAMLAWLSAVREAIVEDLQETAAKARRGIIPPPSEDLHDNTPAVSVPSAVTVPAGSPDDFIEAQVMAAWAAFNAAFEEHKTAAEKKKAAKAALNKWLRVSKALRRRRRPGSAAGAATANDTSPEGDAASASRRRRTTGSGRQRAPSGRQLELPPQQPAG